MRQLIGGTLQPVLTRLITRCFGLIPSLVVAVAVGRPGIATLLVASQVVLSIVLPFVTFPLILLTSSKKIMMVRDDAQCTSTASSEDLSEDEESKKVHVSVATITETAPDLERASAKAVDYSNGKITVAIGAVIWIIIVAANVYAIVGLAMGED